MGEASFDLEQLLKSQKEALTLEEANMLQTCKFKAVRQFSAGVITGVSVALEGAAVFFIDSVDLKSITLVPQANLPEYLTVARKDLIVGLKCAIEKLLWTLNICKQSGSKERTIICSLKEEMAAVSCIIAGAFGDAGLNSSIQGRTGCKCLEITANFRTYRTRVVEQTVLLDGIWTLHFLTFS
ncbi:hypothetical protein SADUNF_Sadunf08G0125300 [Salix dunnii]|uniref:Uncharacterized protein n=1 Tax=Salix dunnii TaxID=1413687 RepID=A0A835JWX0_9ROSI|nr:hypothetical protein SADUNF_Sadunf08G0125300 [Salix dunnii]